MTKLIKRSKTRFKYTNVILYVELKSFDLYAIFLKIILAFQDELFTIHDTICKCECESICEIRPNPIRAESGE